MPELPEVEQFRRILLPLQQQQPGGNPLTVELVKDNPPRKWLTTEDVQAISGKYFCADVLRKGKLVCMVLHQMNDDKAPTKQTMSKKLSPSPPNSCKGNVKYLYLHMGMTGRISAPGVACRFIEGIKDDDGSEFPPSHTYLLLRSGPYQCAFSDPRKFGSAILGDDTSAMDVLAPDALHTLHSAQSDPSILVNTILPKLHRQSMAIKPLLMDQKRVVAGVGNWVADEVLYQCEMHPDQNYLTVEQAQNLCDRLYHILSTAVECLRNDQDFPQEWLFHYRWTNKKAANDHKGRPLAFITSGGRTSAIVASMQKLKKSQAHAEKKAAAATNSLSTKNQTSKEGDDNAVIGNDGSVAATTKAATSRPKKTANAVKRAPKRAAQEAATDGHRGVRRKSPRLSAVQ